MTITARWEHFPHQTDIGVRGLGATPAQAFEQAALALTAVVTDPANVAANDMVQLSCMAPSSDLLLIDWLNSLIFEMVTRNMLFSRFQVSKEGNSLTAQMWGETRDATRHRAAAEVKGTAFSELRVLQQPDGAWLAQCVVDI